MTRLNRGKTTKLSIKLSSLAKDNIEKAAKNLSVSKASVIMFELTKILEAPPSKSHIEEIDFRKEIVLDPKPFVITVNERLSERINNLAEDYGMKKYRLIGYMVSEAFEDRKEEEKENTEPKRLMVQTNEHLKKKMMEYSEENYIPLGVLVSYCILQGPSEEIPSYEEGEVDTFFTNVPEYIGDIIKDQAEERFMREHFYTSSCIYKQFMLPGGRFYN
ncbi:hypothetical protein [Priestia megaterium]|uniref:hypothetical protein n=1 Tax=Priestia megaterium TaxID=1404 RepID=UPI000BFD19C3|nr:hypothetical protein [Priestia megaterium]PGQ88341.1 hypothetical protein COA18_05270 [Priestia megaterium]